MLDDKKQQQPLPQEQFEQGETKFYKIAAVVYMSKGLVAAESDGTSDPFVQLTYGSNKPQTSVKNNTMNCIFYINF